jgi:hypothetical protein
LFISMAAGLAEVAIQLVPLDGVTQPVGWGDLIVGVSG